MRPDGRMPEKMREVKIQRGFLAHAEGSVLVEIGTTKVICAVTVEEKAPMFLEGTGKGWVTAEYGMLPRSTQTRSPREASRGKVGGRTHEIQRLIGRSLRAVTDLKAVGDHTLVVDCDVLQADGGTRTASITGSFVALYDAFLFMKQQGVIKKIPLLDYVAATSVGILDGKNILDLCYAEDSKAEVDMNVVMTGKGQFVEVQGTAERNPFSGEQLQALLKLAGSGIQELVGVQKKLIGEL